MTYDAINPSHYHGDREFEPIDVIEDWGLGYHLGNALKYIARNGRKPGEDPIEGLDKAIWYLERRKDMLLDAATRKAVKEIPSSVIPGSDEDPVPFEVTHKDLLDYESWEAWATRDDYKKRTPGRLEGHEIVYTSKEAGTILGHQKNGDVRILGTYGDGKEEPADNAPCEHEPDFDPFTDDQATYDNFIFKFD